MVQVDRKETSLYEEAKTGLSSLLQQTATVFVGLAVMLLVTRGTPSGLSIALSFCLGTGFVAWSEQKRIKKLRTMTSNNTLDTSFSNISQDSNSRITSASEAQGNTDYIYFSGHGVHILGELGSLIATATDTKELLKQLQSIDFMLPDEVANYRYSLSIIDELKEKLKELYPDMPMPLTLSIHRHAKQLLHEIYDSSNDENKLVQRDKFLQFLEAISDDINSKALEEAHESSSALPQKTLSKIQ